MTRTGMGILVKHYCLRGVSGVDGGGTRWKGKEDRVVSFVVQLVSTKISKPPACDVTCTCYL